MTELILLRLLLRSFLSPSPLDCSPFANLLPSHASGSEFKPRVIFAEGVAYRCGVQMLKKRRIEPDEVLHEARYKASK